MVSIASIVRDSRRNRTSTTRSESYSAICVFVARHAADRDKRYALEKPLPCDSDFTLAVHAAGHDLARQLVRDEEGLELRAALAPIQGALSHSVDTTTRRTSCFFADTLGTTQSAPAYNLLFFGGGEEDTRRAFSGAPRCTRGVGGHTMSERLQRRRCGRQKARPAAKKARATFVRESSLTISGDDPRTR